jgi:hypothetical protein
MTPEQLKVVNDFYELNQQNCEEYGYNVCQFNTLRNENSETDTNIVIVNTMITGLNDNYMPMTETKNFLVEPNGNYYEMDMMKEVFTDNNEVLSYIQNLTNFDWNAK